MRRLFDFIVALVALVFLTPVLAIIVSQILRKLGSPVLFRQVRRSLRGRLFEMVKFRSMREVSQSFPKGGVVG